MELTVYGLDRATPRSAPDHLRRILHELRQGSNSDPTRDALYDAVVVRASDMQHCMDYAYVSLSRERVSQPRADLLQDLRKTILDSNPSLRVQWRTQSGADRTRRVFFTASSKEQGDQMKEILGKWFEEKKYAFYASYVSKPLGPWRVTFDFLDPAHADALLATEPMINFVKYYPRRPRFVTPSYGYQVALLSCRDWLSAKVVLDEWIRRLFHDDPCDPVVYSAMELDGEVYTAILPTWDHAVHVVRSYRDLESYLAADPVTEHIKPVPQPGLLYGLNGVGLSVGRQPASAGPSSSVEFMQLRREFEHTREQGVEMMSTLFRVSTQNTEAIKQLNEQVATVNANSTALAISQSLNSQLLDVNMSLADARRERGYSDMFLLQCDLPPNVSEYHLRCSREREEDIQQFTQQKRNLQAEIAAIHSTLSAALPTRMVAASSQQPSTLTPSARQELASTAPRDPSAAPPPRLQRRSSTASVEDAMEEQVCFPPLSPCLLAPNGLPFRWPSNEPFAALEAAPRHAPVTSPPRPPPLSSSFLPRSPAFTWSSLFLCLIGVLSSFTRVAASSPSISAVTINCNGLANVAKQAAVSSMIATHNPHVWVATETKSSSLLQDRIRAPLYHKFESVGRPLEHGRGSKWGLIVGVQRSFHAQQVPVNAPLQGRVLALDLIVPTSGGHGYLHRIVAVYAPWDPGIPTVVCDFWDQVSSLCATAHHSWTLIGDCNVTLSPSESLAHTDTTHLKRDAYMACLNAADGYDVWQTQHDADARTSYTCRAFAGHGQSIIDRVAVSHRGTLAANCFVPRDFIPATDHRPVLAHIALLAPTYLAGHSPCLTPSFSPPTYPPRFKYPKKSESSQFKAFSECVDTSVAMEHLVDRPVVDDASFAERYQALTRILRSCGTDTFELPQSLTAPPPCPNTPRIRAILLEIRHTNQFISALRQGYSHEFIHRHSWARPYIQDFHAQPSAPPCFHPGYTAVFLSYLTSLRRTLQCLRYRAEHDELECRATRSSRACIDAALLGGSSKRLFVHAHDTDGPPAALQSSADPPVFVTGPTDIKSHTVNYFTELFRRTPRTPSSKPWMDAPTVQSIRA